MKTFTREQVIEIIDDLLQRPDLLIDAVSNEDTNYGADELFEIATKPNGVNTDIVFKRPELFKEEQEDSIQVSQEIFDKLTSSEVIIINGKITLVRKETCIEMIAKYAEIVLSEQAACANEQGRQGQQSADAESGMEQT